MALLPDVQDFGRRPVPRSSRQAVTVRNAGAVGEAVAQVGAGLGEAATELHHLDQRRQGAQAGVDFATMTEGVTHFVNEQRSTAAPGGAGHVAAVRERVQRDVDGFLHSIRDPDVRTRYEGLTAQYRGQLLGEEDAWEIGKRREHSVDNINQMQGQSQAQILTNPDEATYVALDRNLIDSIANGGLDADTAARLQRAGRAALASAYLQGKIERDPNAAREIIRSGILNERLSGDPNAIVRLTDTADSEIRAREADVRREQAAAQTQVRERIAMLDRRFAAGEIVPDSELEEIQQAARAANIPTEVFDVGTYRVRLNVRRQYQRASAVELRNALNQYNERIAQAGDHARPDDLIGRTEVQTMLTSRSETERNSPLAAYSQAGGQVAPVDLNNRASIRARVVAANAAARSYPGGGFQFFQSEEAAALQAQAATPAGRLNLANQLAVVASVDPQAADQAATQVAPQDKVLRRAIRLGPVTRQVVMEGAVSLGQLNQRVVNPDGTIGNFNDRAAAWFRINIAPQLSRWNPQYADDVLETAKAYYAEVSRRAGILARTDFDQRGFADAVNVALGAQGGNGGTAYWSPGPRNGNGSPYGFVLPTGMNLARLERVMSWLPVANLHETWPDGSTNGTPVWSVNGQNMSANDLRSRFVPMNVDDGVYEFHDPRGGAALTREGVPFQLNVNVLAAHPPARALRRAPAPRPSPPPAPARMRSAYEAIPPRDTSNDSPNPTLNRAQWEALYGPLPRDWRPGQPVRRR